MITGNQIRYLTHAMIDKLKWDQCIEKADNNLIYAFSSYLDLIAGKWDALVMNDYEAVMPLPWKKKFSFYYLYQPYFTATLGVFTKNESTISIFDFLKAIPAKFRYCDVDLNEMNNLACSENDTGLNVTARHNHFLSLHASYSDIYTGYKRLGRRMIKTAGENHVQIFRNAAPLEVIQFYRKHYNGKHTGIPGYAYDNLLIAASLIFTKGQAKAYLAKLPGGEIVAAYLVYVDKRFIYSIIGGSSEKGKRTGSFYLLTDAAIMDHSGSERFFRFEGSDIKGIAFFNTQFGAAVNNYLHLQFNSLPFPLNFAKRFQGFFARYFNR